MMKLCVDTSQVFGVYQTDDHGKLDECYLLSSDNFFTY